MQKNTTMYKEFGKDFNFKELRCVPYENAPRIVQTYCLHALQCVEENDVFVNEIPEKRRGKKLFSGDIVQVNDQKYVLILENDC